MRWRELRTLNPRALRAGDTIGVFTPSMPGHVMFPEQYGHGLVERRGLGYGVMEGELTRAGTREGFRSGSPKDRAEECMRLILDERVGALMATMGGVL